MKSFALPLILVLGALSFRAAAGAQPQGPASANIIVIGDSITVGPFGFPQNSDSGYPAIMQGLAIGQNSALVYNLGMAGEKTGDMLGQYYGAIGTTSVSTAVTTTATSTMASIGSATGVSTGMSIGAIGIPPNTTITAISGTTITLSNSATLSKNAVACSIATPPKNVGADTNNYPGGAANGWQNFANTAHQLSYAISGRPSYVFILAGTNDLYCYGAPNSATATTVAGQNTMILTNSHSIFANGDVVSTPNLPEPLPYIVSGGGTGLVTLSAPAIATGTDFVTDWIPVTDFETLKSKYTSLVAAAKADCGVTGGGGAVIALTVLPRGVSNNYPDKATDASINHFNAWLKSGGSGADYVIDSYSAMPPFGPATSNPLYFVDMLHLSFEGTAFLGNFINDQFFAQIFFSNAYATWAGQHGLIGGAAGPYVVLKPDGVSNLTKYALGLDPAVNYGPGAAGLPVVKLPSSPVPKYLTLTFTGVATDVTYTVQAANSPSGPWSTLATYNAGTAPGPVTVKDSQPVTNSPSRFMRLQVGR